jgi:type I restriction enzyme S subunit
VTGRAATTKIQIGDFALSVGRPWKPAPHGWRWVELSELAEMATGHTPSRMHPEYWGGTIKWMCASDARFHHGGVVYETAETINQQGIDNSAAVLLPADTVCLARTGASIGYAVRLGQPMATNQGFVNWICGPNLDPKFFQYILVAESDFLKRIAYGAAHHTIYFPEVKAFHVSVPSHDEQLRIVGILDEAFDGIATAKANAEANLQNAQALFESHQSSVFIQRGKGWSELPLGKLATFRNGINFTKSSRGETVRIVGVKV